MLLRGAGGSLSLSLSRSLEGTCSILDSTVRRGRTRFLGEGRAGRPSARWPRRSSSRTAGHTRRICARHPYTVVADGIFIICTFQFFEEISIITHPHTRVSASLRDRTIMQLYRGHIHGHTHIHTHTYKHTKSCTRRARR